MPFGFKSFKRDHQSTQIAQLDIPVQCGTGPAETWLIENKQWKIASSQIFRHGNELIYKLILQSAPVDLNIDMNLGTLVMEFAPLINYAAENKTHLTIYDRKADPVISDHSTKVNLFDIQYEGYKLRISTDDLKMLSE